MGAWGLGLFQSDHDLDMVSDLDGEAGICDFMEDSGFTIEEDGHRYYDKNGNEVYYSLYTDLCSSTEPLKSYLESGILVDMLNKYAKMTPHTFPNSPPSRATYHEQGYTFVLLCACAQILGCHIPNQYTDRLRSCYRHVGLMPDALKQVKLALDTYKSGEKFDFGSLDLVGTAYMRSQTDNQPSNLGEFHMLNVPTPGPFGDLFHIGSHKMMTGHVGSNHAGNQAHNDTRNRSGNRRSSAAHFAVDECGECGVKRRASGEPLVTCGKCKSQKYCSVKCQKKNWKAHKTMCRVRPLV